VTATTFEPRPGAAPWPRMVAAQALVELRTLLRNGEQLLLVLVIPVGLLVLGATVALFDMAAQERVDFLLPGALALAVMSTSFTGLAIATGFERRYGVLKRLGASPLPRSGLLAGKALSVLAIEVFQLATLVLVALLLGWSVPTSLAGWGSAAILLGVGTIAFAGLGLLLAGLLRAEATLAVANLIYVLFLVGSGVVFPLDRLPAAARPVLELAPLAALAEGLRTAMGSGILPLRELATLIVWGLLAAVLTSRTFRFE
jgi:ABC-2 type transport system permease protein